MFFIFKQNTAYEMRISDWSSDVCSSDLYPVLVTRMKDRRTPGWPSQGIDSWLRAFALLDVLGTIRVGLIDVDQNGAVGVAFQPAVDAERSEERRVGKACVSKCRSRWSPDH